MSNRKKLENLAKEVMLLSRNTLLVNLRFLDAALSQFELIPIEESTVLTDGKHIFYNPKYVLNCYKRAKEIPVRDYLHIVLHCVFRHMYMSPNLNRPYWDLACDIAVENVITELGLKAVTTPRERQQEEYISTIRQELKYVTAEKIYSYLYQTVSDTKSIEEIRESFVVDDHEIWYMTDEEISSTFSTTLSSEESEEKENKTQMEDKENKIQMEALWKNISEHLQMDLETFEKRRGQGFGSMRQNLEAVNREQYDYTTFLKKFAVIGENIHINDDEYDYIFYTYGLQLYKKVPLIEPLEYKTIKAIKEFVIAIDTSGSTSGELVQKFVEKTYNILKSTESFFTKINLHIIQCDANIQDDIKITCQEDFDEYIKTMQICGLGGTDFRPVFEYVDKLCRDREFQNLKGLIYFTDGDGIYPEKKPEFDTAFVFIDDNYYNLSVPPWAIKLILEKEDIGGDRYE